MDGYESILRAKNEKEKKKIVEFLKSGEEKPLILKNGIVILPEPTKNKSGNKR